MNLGKVKTLSIIPRLKQALAVLLRRKTHCFYTSYAATQEPESDRKIDVLLMKYRNKSYLHGGSICKLKVVFQPEKDRACGFLICNRTDVLQIAQFIS